MASSSRTQKSAAKPARSGGAKPRPASATAKPGARSAVARSSPSRGSAASAPQAPIRSAPFNPAARPRSRALSGPEAVKAVLHDATPKARELAETLRRLVKKAAPDAAESADVKANAIYFERKKPFCSISPAEEHVVMSFHRGSDLDDPEAILTGAGKGPRAIRVAQVHDIRGGAFERFVRQARELASR